MNENTSFIICIALMFWALILLHRDEKRRHKNRNKR